MVHSTTRSKVDHRRATAVRNAEAILDAAERLLAGDAPLTVLAVAAEAGVSRPTVYTHYRSVGEIVEAAVARSVESSLAAFDAARPETGPAADALLRMAATSWEQLARFDALARRASEHLPPGALHRSHGALMERLGGLIERGRRDGTFRDDLPADWLITTFYALVHAADEHARTTQLPREEAHELLSRTLMDLFAAKAPARDAENSHRRTPHHRVHR